MPISTAERRDAADTAVLTPAELRATARKFEKEIGGVYIVLAACLRRDAILVEQGRRPGEGSPLRQAVPRPKTWGDYERVRPALIDTYGRPCVTFDCGECHAEHFTVGICHQKVRCPQCGSTARRCRRSSGHDASEWHRARFNEHDRIVDELDRAGFPVVARWADDWTVS